MRPIEIPEAAAVQGTTLELRRGRGAEGEGTVVGVDHPATCESAEHVGGGRWHLYWTTDSNQTRVRIVRMCPKAAQGEKNRRAQREMPKKGGDY